MTTRSTRIALACLAIAALLWLSIRESGGSGSSASLRPPAAPGYQSPARAVAGYIGNMMDHHIEAACNYSLPGYHGICDIAVEGMFLLGSKVTGTWTEGHVITYGNRAIVDVEYNACLGSDCIANDDPNAGLPGSGTSFSTAFRQNLANFNYATDCVRTHGRWYVDVVSGPPPGCAPHPCPSPSAGVD
jgi:hypothetical protein